MNRQKGLALIVSLVVLVVAALFGLSSFQSSQLEERMAANHRFSVSALQSAEAGVNDMMDAVLSFEYSSGGPSFCDSIGAALPSPWVSQGGGVYGASGDISGGGLLKKYDATMRCAANGHVIGFSRGYVEGGDDEELSARLVRVEIVPPGFDAVRFFLSDSDITFNGNSRINGNIHTNNELNINIRGANAFNSSGVLTAHVSVNLPGNLSLDGDCDTAACAVSGVSEIGVPSAKEYIDAVTLAYGIAKVDGVWVLSDPSSFIEILPHDASGNCNISSGNLLEPAGFSPSGTVRDIEYLRVEENEYIYYCPGDLIVGKNVDVYGVTLMAVGDLTHKGAATISGGGDLSGEPITTTIISGGDMEFDGRTNVTSYATFWAEGNFTQNGNYSLFGGVLAKGEVEVNGRFTFTAKESGSLFTPVSGRLEGWVELEDPRDASDFSS